MTDEAQFTVLSGNPTATELAAVTAVLSQAIDELALDDAHTEPKRTSAWARSQRPIRRPLERGIDTWRGFSG